MALIICKDCKKEFSSDSKTCVHCGAKKPLNKSEKRGWLFIGILCLFSLVIRVAASESNNLDKDHLQDTSSASQTQQKPLPNLDKPTNVKTQKPYQIRLLSKITEGRTDKNPWAIFLLECYYNNAWKVGNQVGGDYMLANSGVCREDAVAYSNWCVNNIPNTDRCSMDIVEAAKASIITYQNVASGLMKPPLPAKLQILMGDEGSE